MSIVHEAITETNKLSKRTSFFGLPFWVVIGILIGAFFVFLCCCACLRNRRRTGKPARSLTVTPAKPTGAPSKEIQEKSHRPGPEILRHSPAPSVPEIRLDMEKAEHRVVEVQSTSSSDKVVSSVESKGTAATGHESSPSGTPALGMGPEVPHLGSGKWYTLRELEAATGGLCEENVIGEGGYGIVYHGVLGDGTKIAVKNLLNRRGEANRDFVIEVEAMSRVRHKNLVRLLGYCAEGTYRMLVYEYVDNGTLEQWLHGDVGDVSPLTWDTRMDIILGTARGLAYLHEGLETKIVHRDVKSSNILIDRQWNSKVADFGLAKLMSKEKSYVTTRVMGTFGYVAPEYACTGMLTEKSDVYSFGILIMEIITGRSPVDYARPQEEVNLMEWLKTMVGNRKSEEVVDPRLPEKPPSKALKHAILIAIRCVDPEPTKRPKMGNVCHMLEEDDQLFIHERKTEGESLRPIQGHRQGRSYSNSDESSDERITDQSEDDSSRNHPYQPTSSS